MEEKQTFLEKFWYLFVIIAVFSLGSVVFLWMNNQNINQIKQQLEENKTLTQQTTPTPTQQTTPTPSQQQEEVDEAIQKFKQQSSGDEIKDIENDLQNTDFTGIDKELDEIEKMIEEE